MSSLISQGSLRRFCSFKHHVGTCVASQVLALQLIRASTAVDLIEHLPQPRIQTLIPYSVEYVGFIRSSFVARNWEVRMATYVHVAKSLDNHTQA